MTMRDAGTYDYAAQAALYAQESRRSLAALVGIAQGLLGDRHLSDAEIRYLRDWLVANDAITFAWPGDIIYARVKTALEDGVITEDERAHLVETLQALLGGTVAEMAACARTTQLAFDAVATIEFSGATFCLTGDFLYAPREVCERAIQRRGGLMRKSVSKQLRYLVVGARGSEAWKHGSFGTKIERAMMLKHAGAAILVVDEQVWTSALERCPAAE